MGRITIKGGSWKNTEDEILKAAVMKYGKNQWSRISSLLVRKSAKQCKARWYEWLDPSIKKVEWTREEEEKLLHLAKIMPCQWRSIAPMIGRTAAQCLEHYERLLDAAQAGEEVKNDSDVRRDDPRRLKPGEVDPLVEAKPAMPDPVDMDEDEKEMLSEARARLANTKGKKAKRKARERQLEEARRLAVIQKKRELRAAGIELGNKNKRKREIDYDAEVPFEKKPPPGFFDHSQEDARAREEKREEGFKVLTLEDLEGKSREQIEMEERKKDARRIKLHKETNLPEQLAKINAMNDPAVITRRAALNLPAPQVSDNELEQIAKLTHLQQQQQLQANGTNNGSHATRALLATYANPTPNINATAATPVPTRTPMREDNILLESQNLLRMRNMPTPLLGGANPELNASDFSGITPKHVVASTPNPLATPLRQQQSGFTPKSATSSVPSTPIRDGLNINAEGSMHDIDQRRPTKKRNTESKLSKQLQSLPTPQNEYAIVLPDIDQEDEPGAPSAADDEKNINRMVDAEDIIRANQEAKSLELEQKRQLETIVIQQGLIRPKQVNKAAFKSLLRKDDAQNKDLSLQASKLIEEEMLTLLRGDASRFPLDASKKPSSQATSSSVAALTVQDLAAAKALIEEEVKQASTSSSSPNSSFSFSSLQDFQQHFKNTNTSEWNELLDSYIFDPTTRSYAISTDLTSSVLIQAYSQEFELLRSHVKEATKKASKLEQQLNVQLGGYMNIHQNTLKDITKLHQELVMTEREKSCFLFLKQNEEKAIPQRKAELSKLVQQLKEQEKELQLRYKNLTQSIQAQNQEMQQA